VVLANGYLLQSIDADGNGNPGVNTDERVADSHQYIGYEYAVRPENWLGQEEATDLQVAGDGRESTDTGTTVSEVGVSLEQLQSIMPNLPDAGYLSYLNAAMAEAYIDTPLRQAAFLAQLAHESGELRWFEEFADGWDYEGREDLGNINQGDGPRYKGRGPIQLTGRANYARAGDALGLDLVNDPDCVATPEVGFRTACWYWNQGNPGCGDLNSYADAGTQEAFDSITVCINGGYNGKESRDAYYWYAREVLGSQPS
jgi:putative chitinase